jgi:hypothetical protein
VEHDLEEIVRRLGDLHERGLLTEAEHKDLFDQAQRELAAKAEPPVESPRLDQEPTGEDVPTDQVAEEPGPDLVAQKAAELKAAEAVFERKRIELEEAEQAEQERLEAEAAAELQAQEAEREELERLRVQEAEREELERLRAQQAERQELEQLRVEKAALEAERERLEEEREEAETERKRLQEEREEAETERKQLQEEREEAETERKQLQEERKQSEGPLDQERWQESSDEATPVSGGGPTPRNRRTVLAAVGAGIAAIVILLLVTRGDSENPTANPVEPTIAPTTTVPATTQAPTTTVPATTQAPTTTVPATTQAPTTTIPATTTVLSAAATTTTTSTSTLDEDTRVLTLDYSWGPCDAWGPCDEVETLQALLGVSADGVYGPGTRSAHLAELERRTLPTSGVPLPPPTTFPPPTTSLAGFFRTVEVLGPSSFQVVRGEEVTIRWRVSDIALIVSTHLFPSGNPSFFTHGYTYSGSLVSSTPGCTFGSCPDGGSWEYEATILSAKLPVGISVYEVSVYGLDASGEGFSYWSERPKLTVTVETLEPTVESLGPVISLIGATPSEMGRDETTIVQWSVVDESGVEEVSYASGYATSYRANCSSPAGGAWSVDKWGSLESGTVTDGVFAAEWSIDAHDAVSNMTGTGRCSLAFFAIDKWGNWTRHDTGQVITVHPAAD